MAVLSDQNLVKFKSELNALSMDVTSLHNSLTKARSTINDNVGATFRAEYAVGKKATTNITAIIDILQSLEADLKALVEDSETFYNKSKKAQNK